MTNLSVNYLGIPMKTPLIGASGTVGFGLEIAEYVDMNKVGAISGKGLAPTPWKGNEGIRVAETDSGMLNAIGLENPGVPYFIEHYLPKVKKLGVPFIANMVGKTTEEYAECAKMLTVDGVDALEVNISCPNVKEGGVAFGTDPKQAAAVTRAIKDSTNLPVIVKLSPNVTDIVTIAKAVEDAGADSLSLVNTLLGLAIDVRTRRPILGNITGGFAGPAIKPVALRMVWQVAKAVNIPVTVKTRLGWDADNKIIVDLAEQLQDCGIAALSIHGRTRAQMYTGEADWTLIGEVKNNPRIHIPIIGNGDVTSAEICKQRFDNYGVDGVMIGRGSIGRPWIFREVKHFLTTGEALPEEKFTWYLDILKQQVNQSVERLDERRGILHIRRHLAATPLFKGISDFKQTRVAMLRAETVSELFDIMDSIPEKFGIL